MFNLDRAIAATALVLLAGCSITQSVKEVAATRPLTELCIVENDKVHMSGFLPELSKQIEALGIKTRVVAGAVPPGCRHHLTYTANWAWDLAMYLTFAELTVHEGDTIIGTANYDARSGGGNMGKFGPTSEKLQLIVKPLFEKAAPRKTSWIRGLPG